MPLKKIRDIKPPCLDQEHNPPPMVLEPGQYEWTCPKCGSTARFTVYGYPHRALPEDTGKMRLTQSHG